MTLRWTIPAALSFLLCIAVAPSHAQDDVVGVVTDPCATQKTPDQVPAGQWMTYILSHDFGKLCQYRAQNAELLRAGNAPRVVFMGDSITEFWGKQNPAFFTNGYVDRGISGQTTSQMLLRFRQDVIDLHPQAVHILAGTNDVAGNTGPVTLEQVEGNIASMAELAKANGIRVILGSIPPAAHFQWRPEIHPVDTIRTLNAWIKTYAARNGFAYVDYYDALTTAQGGMKQGLADDGVHPTKQGYAAMEPLARAAIQAATPSK
ncbi:Esterase TesA [Dyella sp. AD56]|uniref:SGNH/GDSL hydrolase family protein n=1 Tax=Dyella sp. AD56 TaxID=1528744 RepID=UPI000C847097|nr:SGNH/GDSL hydrolase family protein [Dyella sp. AD56]PMQ06798.1 Esterase TesA [Dyella sp. AD56]